MQEAVEKNLEKVLAEKQEQLEKKVQDKLKGLLYSSSYKLGLMMWFLKCWVYSIL